ncbi:MAG: hypothetical protein J6A28_00005 [Clostridia bacterium]|nr:hypothetical protein [Clostridia bacterium]
MERTYIMVKPEFANSWKLLRAIRNRIKSEGFQIVQASFVKYEKKDAQEHYAEHFRGSYKNAKPFYKGLEEYITSDKAYGMIVEGENAKARMREVIKELRISIPASMGKEPDSRKNILHGSDLTEGSEVNEIKIFTRLAQSYSKKKIEAAREL